MRKMKGGGRERGEKEEVDDGRETRDSECGTDPDELLSNSIGRDLKALRESLNFSFSFFFLFEVPSYFESRAWSPSKFKLRDQFWVHVSNAKGNKMSKK